MTTENPSLELCAICHGWKSPDQFATTSVQNSRRCLECRQFPNGAEESGFNRRDEHPTRKRSHNDLDDTSPVRATLFCSQCHVWRDSEAFWSVSKKKRERTDTCSACRKRSSENVKKRARKSAAVREFLYWVALADQLSRDVFLDSIKHPVHSSHTEACSKLIRQTLLMLGSNKTALNVITVLPVVEVTSLIQLQHLRSCSRLRRHLPRLRLTLLNRCLCRFRLIQFAMRVTNLIQLLLRSIPHNRRHLCHFSLTLGLIQSRLFASCSRDRQFLRHIRYILPLRQKTLP